MKKPILLIVLLLGFFSGNAVHRTDWAKALQSQSEIQALQPEVLKLSMQKFLDLTPQKYQEMTGEKLGIKKSLELKIAQKIVKKHYEKAGGDIEKGLYIVLAILGLGWVAMGVMDDWSGNDWIINLILTALCWIPGVIHALVKMKKYY